MAIWAMRGWVRWWMRALPLNTHLRSLNLDRIRCTNDFARARLLPAVRANTSLRHLSAEHLHDLFAKKSKGHKTCDPRRRSSA
jgi:hypothetical protein